MSYLNHRLKKFEFNIVFTGNFDVKWSHAREETGDSHDAAVSLGTF